MQCVRSLTNLDVEPLREHLASCGQPFKTSELYATADASRFADTSVRLSESRAIVDPKLAALSEALVKEISASDTQYDYVLCPDNITHIKYSSGGFFKRHTDHCRGASNLIEEFTLVVNVNPDNVPCEGGSTVIHLPSGSASTFATTFDQTTQLGGGLLFRKDLEHEGLPVASGEKHLLCMNVWGRRLKQGQVLLVTFEGAPASSTSDASALRAASLAKTHALAAEEAEASHALKLVIDGASRLADEAEAPRPAVVRYAAPEGVDFDTFDLVCRICRRMHLTAAMLEGEARQRAIDYFFPGACFKWENLLLEQAGLAEPSYPATPSSELVFDSMLLAQPQPDDAAADLDVIVTGSAERTRVVAELARELELPYVEFNFAFVKGDFTDTGGDEPLTQVWLSLGGYDSIFSFQRVHKARGDGHSSIGVQTLSLALAHKDVFRVAHRSPFTQRAKHVPYSALDAVPDEFNPVKRDFSEIEDPNGWGVGENLNQTYCYGLRAATSSIETNQMASVSKEAFRVEFEQEEGLEGEVYDEAEFERAWRGRVATMSASTSAMVSLAFEHDQSIPTSLEYLPGGSSFDEASSARAKAQPWHAEAAAAAALRKDEVRPILDALKEKMEKKRAPHKESFRAHYAEYHAGYTEDEFEAAWEVQEQEHEEQDDLYGDVSEYSRSDPTLAEDDGDHGVAAPAGAWLFHRDEHGKTCFNEAEARAACELIAAIKLDERVVAAMADTEFVFPQEHASAQAYVCNGEEYGEFVLLQVTGVVRLEAKPELVKAAKEEEVARRKQRLEQLQKREAEEAERNAKRARIAAGEEVEEEEAEEEEVNE